MRVAFGSADDFYFNNVTLTPLAGATAADAALELEAAAGGSLYLPSVRQRTAATTSEPETAVAADEETSARALDAAGVTANVTIRKYY